ncbi:MAG: uracil-DNA glycosylase [Clostridia bacterium]|nr:uracil-DNA glycosylase [Clostridia bacterium]
MVNIGNDWDEILAPLFESELYASIRGFLKQEYSTKIIYPPMHDIFNAFKYTPYNEVKAVILGQDPYHNEGQAHGLCFSVKEGVQIPPSLVNIYKEMQTDLGIVQPNSGCLTKWAKQGVMLLNTTLTVREGAANSHSKCGWQQFTDEVIKILAQRETPMVFLLWGSNARSKKQFIKNGNHLVLESVHPSPLSAYGGFFGCKHFSKTNEFLIKNKLSPINWDLNE